MKIRDAIHHTLIVGLLSLFCFPKNTNSQAEIVFDATAAVNATNMITVFKNVYTTIKETKEQADSVMASIEFLQDMKETGTEVKRLYSLLESMVCATDEFNMYIGFIGGITACNKRLRIDMTISRLDGIPKQMERLLSGALRLTKGESITKLKNINDALEKTAEEFLEINEELRGDLEAQIEYEKKFLPFSARYPLIWEHETGQKIDYYTSK